MTTRTFEFKDDKSSKFWEITQAGSKVTVRYGKTGTHGQTQEKVFADASDASKHVEKLVTEKTGKGYVGRDGAPTASDEMSLISGAAANQAGQQATKAKAPKAPATKPKNPLQDPEATPESLMILLGPDDTTNRRLAKHPRSSGELLEKLSHSSDESTRKGVASHPNAAPEVLIRLAQQFPQEFLTNPALDLLLMVNPALMEDMPEALLVRLLKQADCPASLLTWAAGHPQAKVQLAVAMNAKVPAQALIKLRESKHAAVRESLQTQSDSLQDQDPEKAFELAVRERLGSMGPDELEESWSSGDIGLAQWPALPLTFRVKKATNAHALSPAAIVRMLMDTSWTLEAVRQALPGYRYWDEVAGDPKTPVAALQTFAKDSDPSVRRSLAKNPATPIAMLEELAKDKEVDYRKSVAENPSTPIAIREALLEELAKDSDPWIRRSAAKTTSTPAALLEALAKDKNSDVRHAVAENPSSPVSVLEGMANDADLTIRQSVAINPSTSKAVREALLEALANENDARVRKSVAENPSAPVSVLLALAKDKDERVHRSVARNPSVPESVLEAFANESDPRIHLSIVENPSTPIAIRVAILEALANDSAPWLRVRVGKNDLASQPLLVALSKDEDNDVRAAVASNLATAPEVLVKLASDRVTEVVIAAVHNLQTPLSALTKLTSHKAVSVREALAAHAHRSADLCRTLWQDANKDVRLALISNPELDFKVLDEMAQSAGLEQELDVLLGHPNLSSESAQMTADKLVSMPATASPWYRDELAKARPEVVKAVEAGSVLSYFGKDPNKAVLSKRAIAPVMALCSGPFVEPSRIVKVAGSTDWLVRAAVARNPGTPPNILKKLSSDAHPMVAKLARSAVRKESGEDSRDLAQTEVVLDLSRATEEVIGRIPSKELRPLFNGLASFFVDDVWSDQLTVGQISWMTAVLAKAQQKALPFASFPSLNRSLDSELAALQTEAAVAYEQERGTVSSYVRMWAAEEPTCPVHVLRKLANDENLYIVLAALRHPAFPQEEKESTRQRLMRLRGKQLDELLADTAAPSEILEALSTAKDVGVLRLIAGNPSTPAHVLKALVQDSSELILQSLAKNPSTPVDVLQTLFKDKKRDFRAVLAKNPSTPSALLEALAKESDLTIRRNVLRHPSTPLNVQKALLEALAQETDKWDRKSVAENPSTPVEVLQALATDTEVVVRLAVAKNMSTPSAIREALLEALHREPDVTVRESVAWNTCTPVSTLETLAKDSDVKVRLSVAKNPSTPSATREALFEALARDSDASVRRAVGAHPYAPLKVLSALAEDACLSVRASCLWNRTSPADLRDRFLNWWLARLQRAIQRELDVRKGTDAAPRRAVRPVDLVRALDLLGLVSPDDDNKALTKASRSKDWLTRLGVALHPSATEGILKLLRQDTDPDVARAAVISRSSINEMNSV